FTSRHLRPEECEDAAQEALLKIFRRAAEFEPSRPALAWALGIAAFEIRTARRRRQRRREEPPPEDAFESQRHPDPTPEEAALTRDLEAAVGRSLLLLPIVALALFCCSDPARILISGLCLLAAVTFCLWRGQAYGRGVRPGLLAGIVPLAVPLAAQAGGHLCDAGRCL